MCCSWSEIQMYIWSCSTEYSNDRTKSWGGYKRAGSDRTRLQNTCWGGEERSEKPWLSPVSAAVLHRHGCAAPGLCCPRAGSSSSVHTPHSRGHCWWHSQDLEKGKFPPQSLCDVSKIWCHIILSQSRLWLAPVLGTVCLHLISLVWNSQLIKPQWHTEFIVRVCSQISSNWVQKALLQ